jgi:pectate lyase
MKKVASILAVVVFAVGMVSCTNDNANNDELYDSLEVMANDDDNKGSTGGSGGN